MTDTNKTLHVLPKPKADPETVAKLHALADMVESGECAEFVLIFVAQGAFQSHKFASPGACVTMTALLHRQAVDALLTGEFR